MDLATGNHPQGPAPKRVRIIDPPVNKPAGIRYTPTEMAYHTKASFTESLPQPTIKSLSEHHFERVFALLKTIERHDNTQSRHKDKDFFPISTRVKIPLTASKRVQETQEYRTLADHHERLLLIFKNNIKESIGSLVELEKKSAKAELRQVFTEAVVGLTAILVLNDSTLHDSVGHYNTVRNIVGYTIDTNHALLMHSGFEDLPLADFFAALKSTIDKHWSSDTTVYSEGDLEQDDLPCHSIPHMPGKLDTFINSLFVAPWKNYLKAKMRQQREVAMQKFLDTNTKGPATNATAMELDQNDEALNQQKISELIDKRVDKRVKALSNKYEKLAEKVQRSGNPKDGRGANNTGASIKKKNAKGKEKSGQKKKTAQTQKKKQTTTARKNRTHPDSGDEADEADNASNESSSNTRRGPRSQSKSKKKSTKRPSNKSRAK